MHTHARLVRVAGPSGILGLQLGACLTPAMCWMSSWSAPGDCERVSKFPSCYSQRSNAKKRLVKAENDWRNFSKCCVIMRTHTRKIAPRLPTTR